MGFGGVLVRFGAVLVQFWGGFVRCVRGAFGGEGVGFCGVGFWECAGAGASE